MYLYPSRRVGVRVHPSYGTHSMTDAIQRPASRLTSHIGAIKWTATPLPRNHAQLWEQWPIVTASRVTVTRERKTGVKHAEVVTTRLVRDERGWLGLAG